MIGLAALGVGRFDQAGIDVVPVLGGLLVGAQNILDGPFLLAVTANLLGEAFLEDALPAFPDLVAFAAQFAQVGAGRGDDRAQEFAVALIALPLLRKIGFPGQA